MRISVLTPDLSSNCLGRAYLLAKILQRHYEVEILGPIFGDGIWEPVADDKSIEYKFVKIAGRFKPYWQIKELFKKIGGDVIYVSKPLFTSFGIGLIKKFTGKQPLILDIDDWQMGFIKDIYKDMSLVNRIKFFSYSAIFFYSIGSYWNNFFGEKLTHLADDITVSNPFLQKKFGGEVIWHVRDTNYLDPCKFDGLIKRKYGMDGKKVVMFFGTPRPHKGIEDLIKAISLIKLEDVVLVIVGIDESMYSQEIVKLGKKLLNRKFIEFNMQPLKKVPTFLSMSDIVVIPQRRNLSSIGQVPAKVFDAMAMAKPIVSTNVSDIPNILDGCGWIVEPENPYQLAQTIQYVFDNPIEAKEKGRKARKKCMEKFSYEAIEDKLFYIFSKYE
jgi:glycosyltransferase involved in cell wall biosynthesis